MELRHLRYFVGVGDEQHFGRAAERLHIAQPALSRQIQDLEKEIGFLLFDRLPRGVKLSAAGEVFLEDARRILAEVQEATRRAGRVANGNTGSIRVGFVEAISWHGVVPDSFRRFREKLPDAELTPVPMVSVEQVEAVRTGKLDAGFIASMGALSKELDQLQVAQHSVVLAAPKEHPLAKQTRLRLRDLNEVPFVWLSRRINPAAYDRLIETCFRGGLKSPRIVQEAYDHATILSLVSCRLGVAWVSDSAKWQCPKGVVLLPVVDLKVPIPFSLMWRKDNRSPLLQTFLAILSQRKERASLASYNCATSNIGGCNRTVLWG
ncbi:MAG TPA: LysR family transcriptional regulator [Candidatus Acidoferrales bacterium]|nr:LysR family transcriptional regulator [Candidatus Acidoferrales bacterium]